MCLGLADGLDRASAKQHTLEVRCGHLVAERGLVDVAELGELKPSGARAKPMFE